MNLAPLAVDLEPSALLDEFLCSKSEFTRRGYASSMRALAAYLGVESPQAAAAALLGHGPGFANRLALAWRSEMLAAGLAPNSVNARVTALRSLVRFARLCGAIQWQVDVSGIRAQTYRDTRGPDEKSVSQILAFLERARSPKEMRDRAVVRLMLDRGLRRTEVARLRLQDVDLVGERVALLGKGRHEREWLTIAPGTVSVLRAWLRERGAAPGPLFLSFTRGSRARTGITPRQVARVVAAAGRASGIPDLSPHQLRHAAITRACDVMDGDVRAVRLFSRHADVRTVLVYDDNRKDLAGEVARRVCGEVA